VLKVLGAIGVDDGVHVRWIDVDEIISGEGVPSELRPIEQEAGEVCTDAVETPRPSAAADSLGASGPGNQ
jgi:hypothetical protein